MQTTKDGKLKFDQVSHTYRRTDNGAQVKSVTQVIDAAGLTDFDSIPIADDVKARAMLRGTYTHKATELFDRNELDVTTLDDTVRPYFSGWAKFRADTGFMPIEIELQLLHPTLNYCGTLDRIGLLGGRHVTLDIKTGAACAWTRIQTAAYSQLAAGNQIACAPERYALELQKTGRYKLHGPWTDPNDFNVFLAALTITNWHDNKGL